MKAFETQRQLNLAVTHRCIDDALGFLNYELRITNYELRTTNYELRIIIPQIFTFQLFQLIIYDAFTSRLRSLRLGLTLLLLRFIST
ncbi:hypothetical protein NIES2107_71440 (plasmid) [Nostoc carneum NIES-2107]|nr:hypothetical protein NIES2107_71440 [Nostoc carneum NIES-2107]